MTTTWDVIVVGGGIAGLAAGATAAQGGATTLVLDSRRPGGRARVSERDGFVFNMGAHAFYLAGEGHEVLRRLGVRLAGSAPALEGYRLLMDGRLHLMPSGPASLLRTTALSKRSKAQLAKLLAVVPRLRAADHAHVSVDGWFADRDLRPDAEAVARALVRIGTYASAFDDLSAEAAIVQLQRAIAKGVLYLDGGWAQVIDGLASSVEVRTRTAVRSVHEDGSTVVVDAGDEAFRARAVVVAPGTPAATRAILPSEPAWGDVGEPVVAACLDAGVRGVPSPGYVLGVDEPVYGTTQAPPAKQAPPGDAVVAVIRYGARSAEEDRPLLERWLRTVGVRDEDVVASRFLARMTVTGAQPRAVNGGFAGRPRITASGVRNVFLAGDWVGTEGLLADAALASGHAAGLAALQAAQRSATMVA